MKRYAFYFISLLVLLFLSSMVNIFQGHKILDLREDLKTKKVSYMRADEPIVPGLIIYVVPSGSDTVYIYQQ